MRMHVVTVMGLVAILAGCAAQRDEMVLVRGMPTALEGRDVRVGQEAPDVRMIAQDMSEIRLSDYRGSVVLLATVPSLDTGVCSMETQTFNERAATMSDDVVVLTVSRDLPTAQARWCGLHGVSDVVVASDYRYGDVGRSFGVELESNGLLARTIFVIDAEGVIRYQQIVPEVTQEPDYDEAIEAAEAAG